MLAWLSIRVIYVYRAIAPDSIRQRCRYHPSCSAYAISGNDSNLLIVFYVQIMPDDFVMQRHRF
ncbi:TPA: membrane protein insertion efficiency factor YidD [Klebsiella pneumoniae]|uniref:membrane protein insertion efficiency factor YidD n=1 Tax=Raoultella ornithinolytica TaxID=54291 RepID=UPI0027FFEA43|nr:membrane protein insertion efficiency factor YidD [Klebsiella pneumoniae]HBR2155679.1 membrane protein insertion efficiency factor YidD [Klebsiella pneumoniae]